ncbi:hypothetical protein HYH03_014406 [Edaphochlamys debaryana]|uniref:FIST C-domain domain-containing protein n=1 Tax=Edaphochlamys debaryana TaxID=47281 RepID=A0A835XP17_9CHLO|nr:hypothetical protein HYH03_014406 [Edaphochlamys debaryana]|eukprot:KAG2486907.1 hypothetical protein HYH03_014406 [Edaphochlamys debaryana]
MACRAQLGTKALTAGCYTASVLPVRIGAARLLAGPTDFAGRRVACAAANPDAAAPATAPQPAPPFWRTHISRKPTLLQSLFDAIAAIRKQGPIPDRLDLAMVYVSSAYEQDYAYLVDALRAELPGLRNVFGCSGYGIIGVDEEGPLEVEESPALSLTLASIPQADVVVRHVDAADLPDGDAAPDRWSSLLGVPAFPESPLSLVVLADPGFNGILDLLAGLDYAFPSANKIGGLASSASAFSSGYATGSGRTEAGAEAGAAGPGPAVSGGAGSGAGGGGGGGGGAVVGGGVYRRGAAVLCLHGEVQMDLVIAQGCRPLTSTTWTVDEVAPADPTRIMRLSCEGVNRGKPLPALEAFQRELQSVLGGMSEAQVRRTVSNLTVGIAPDGMRPAATLEPQDFLIRALRGFDSEACLVVGDYMRVGQRIRFMVRDRQGAQEDLTSHALGFKKRQLQAMLEGVPQQPPFGMFMFTCNGRGYGLYGEPSYDARTMGSYIPAPAAGFLCNGEIGKVGNTTHLHGFTCAVGLLRLTADVPSGGPPAGGATAPAAEQEQGQGQQGQGQQGQKAEGGQGQRE